MFRDRKEKSTKSNNSLELESIQMDAKEYQGIISSLLASKLDPLEVKSEWTAFRGLSYQYSPRVDIAVGPFSVTPGGNQTREYNRILQTPSASSFLRSVYDCHIENIGDQWINEIAIPELDYLIQKNQNARCFIAFEIENSSSKKHIMGSMINAASLGRVGVGVAFNDSVLRTFVRILNYLGFLKRVEKNTYDSTNFLIITKEQLQ
ncbi:MAG: hypothetical protein COB85_09900, partial [Bacteroidetes bacterium]